MATRTTECEKLHKVSGDSQKIGAFLDWLQNERHVVLCQYDGRNDYPFPIHTSIEKLLAEYFGELYR